MVTNFRLGRRGVPPVTKTVPGKASTVFQENIIWPTVVSDHPPVTYILRGYCNRNSVRLVNTSGKTLAGIIT